ncbi:hypothetical protein ACFLYA_00460 [Candidatus Dependentiae bacterium]
MYHNVSHFIKIFLFSLFFVKIAVCVDIGSDTAVDRFTSQQILNNGDRVAGFAFLLGGFELSSASVSATFDSFFPVSGNIEFNSGTLTLSRDLILRDVSNIVTFGSIVGSNHTLELAPSISYLPTQDATGVTVDLSDVELLLNSDIYLNNICIRFSGESKINGKGNCLTLSPTSTMVIDSDSSLLFMDILIKDIRNVNIYCIDSTSTMSVQHVAWVQNGNYRFDQGHFEVIKDFHIIGDGYIFSYETDQESVIKSNAGLILDNNVTFSYAPSTSNRDLINLYDDTSEIILRGATLFSTTTGLRLTRGNLLVERKSSVFCDGTVEGEAISFGDGQSSLNDLNVQCVGAANLEILGGYIAYNNVNS